MKKLNNNFKLIITTIMMMSALLLILSPIYSAELRSISSTDFGDYQEIAGRLLNFNGTVFKCNATSKIVELVQSPDLLIYPFEEIIVNYNQESLATISFGEALDIEVLPGTRLQLLEAYKAPDSNFYCIWKLKLGTINLTYLPAANATMPTSSRIIFKTRDVTYVFDNLDYYQKAKLTSKGYIEVLSGQADMYYNISNYWNYYTLIFPDKSITEKIKARSIFTAQASFPRYSTFFGFFENTTANVDHRQSNNNSTLPPQHDDVPTSNSNSQNVAILPHTLEKREVF